MEASRKTESDAPHAGTQSRDPERNRKLLLDATLDSVAEVGIAETTVSAIIDRAGLSRGMIHLHFAGKDALLDAAAGTFSNEYYSQMDRRLSHVSDDPVEVVSAFEAATPMLSQRLKAEMAEREVRSIACHTKGARFPSCKALAGFDFASSDINEAIVRQLHRGEFIENAENVCSDWRTGN